MCPCHGKMLTHVRGTGKQGEELECSPLAALQHHRESARTVPHLSGLRGRGDPIPWLPSGHGQGPGTLPGVAVPGGQAGLPFTKPELMG